MEIDTPTRRVSPELPAGLSRDPVPAAVRSAVRLFRWSLVPACIAMLSYGPMIYFLGEPFSANVYDCMDPDVAGMVSLAVSALLLAPFGIAWYRVQTRLLPARSVGVRWVSIVLGLFIGTFVAVTTVVTLSFVALLIFRGESPGTMPVWGLWWALSIVVGILNISAALQLRTPESRRYFGPCATGM